MTTIVKAHHASDFLALVPQLAGFQPRNSVVLVAFRGRRTCGALRFDLPSAGSVTALKRIATTVIGILCKLPGIDGVVPVAYTDDRFRGTVGIPHADFMHAIVRCAKRSGFRVRDALCVAADGWGGYLDEDTPENGYPLDDIATSAVGDTIPVSDKVVLGDVADRARIPAVDLATTERVARLLAQRQDGRWCAGLPGRSPAGGAGASGISGAAGLVELALGSAGSYLSDEDAASLLWQFQSPGSRDAAMLQFAFGVAVGEAARVGEEQFWHGDDRGALRSASLMFGEGPRPDPHRVEQAIAVLLALTARAPASLRPAPLTMLGWLSWALGRGSVAGSFVEQALAIDPDYGMAGLLGAMLDAGRLPEWAFAEPDTQPGSRPGRYR